MAANSIVGVDLERIDRELRDEIEPSRRTSAPSSRDISLELLLEQRNGQHGDYATQSRYTQLLKAVCHNSKNWEAMSHAQKEGLEMICLKMGRILAGDHRERDHFIDIAGYARLVENELAGGQ